MKNKKTANEIGGERSLAPGQTRSFCRAASTAAPVSSAVSSPVTTRFTQAVKTIADIEALERLPYESLVPARNLHHLFEATARLHPDRPALTVLTRGSRVSGDVTLTHRQLLAEITRAANLFRSHGIGASDGTLAFLCPILPQLFPALLGAQVAGVASSINYLLSEDAIADLLEAQNATVLVVASEAADPAIWAKATSVAKRVPSLRTIFVMGANGPLPGGVLSFDQAAGARDTLDFEPSADRDTVCALFHTGGTTGRPKLVRLTHGNQIHAAWSFAQVHGLDELDAAVNGFPLFHVGGTITVGLSILAAGGHVIIPSPYSLRSPDAIRDYWHTVERFGATIVSGVPTSIAALAEVPIGSSDISSVRMALTGGAVAPKAVSERFQARTGITLFETYGMTETAAAIAFNPGRGTPVQGSVGFRAPFAQTKIVALDDAELRTECPPLTSGLVLARGPQVFPGYLDPRHNEGVLTADHWIVTGDIGYLTTDQRLVLTGREKDLIVRSGHNIDPAAIEDVANAFPGVQMSSAVGMPDAYAGEVPILFVVPSPGKSIDLPQLREHLERGVHEPPARPKRVVLLEALPVTAVGKIFKPTLRDLAVQEKARSEIDRIFGPETAAEILVEKDARLNTLVHISIDSRDQDRVKALTESLTPLPQTYRITTRSS
ncbi:AMP-binding protein [Bradyrhizobium diazoefficiens]|nr:AMP-binding protein [Bradyrhizobium diazoefficiens]